MSDVEQYDIVAINGRGIRLTMPAVKAGWSLTLHQPQDQLTDGRGPARMRAVLRIDGVAIARSMDTLTDGGANYVFNVTQDWPARRVDVSYEYLTVAGQWAPVRWTAHPVWPADRVIRQ